MSTFVLIPGAGGAASFWYRVTPLLEAGGHEAIAVDLPGADESAGLPEYTDLVLAAMGGPRGRGAGGPVDGRVHGADGVRPRARPPADPGQRDDPAARRDAR